MRPVRAALIQAQANMSKQEAIDKHVKMIADAAGQGAQVVGLQEIFHGPSPRPSRRTGRPSAGCARWPASTASC